MGVQHFFKQRRPRQFSHKPIYWDPRKEELEERIERVRQEMIASGELVPSGEEEQALREAEQEKRRNYDATKALRGTFLRGTEHLQRQQERGIDAEVRHKRMIRLMLVLLGLGFAIWYFFFR